MCRTIKNGFDKKVNYMALYEAHMRARKMKRSKKEVLKFELDLETNITNLYRSIQNGSYRLGKYREFKIYEPKERIIKSLPYQDRVVHQWYIKEFIKPYFMPRFIHDTYACLDDRGTHKAVLQVQNYLRKMKREEPNYYILKCDIKKFFYTIDKMVLIDILATYISDKKLLEFSKKLIFDDTGDIGIPIGNYTSQFFANIYLNELDQFVKTEMKVRYYVRYMDDFILLLRNKEDAKEAMQKIQTFVEQKLHLSLNQKSNYYPNHMGVNFCGYRIFETHLFLRERSKRKIKKQIKLWNQHHLDEDFDLHSVQLKWNSWLGHSSHANSYRLQCKLYHQIVFHRFLKVPGGKNKVCS